MSKLSPEIERYLLEHIDSLEELEVLSILASEPNKSWTVPELDRVIRSTASSIASRVASLRRQKLVVEQEGASGSYVFKPATPELEKIGRELVNGYRKHRLEYVELIFSKPTRAILSFSRSFKIKGDSDDS